MHQQTYPHIYEINPVTRFYGKTTGVPVHLPYWFCTAENAVCRSYLTVHQSNHFTTLRTSEFTQVSPFLSMVTKGHFMWYAFLNVWKHLLLAGDGFADVRSIDSYALPCTRKVRMAPWFQRCIGLQLCGCDVPFGKLEKLISASCLSRTCTALRRANLHISFMHAQRIQK